MTRCPKCNRTFNDPSLSFCIDDGSQLERYENSRASEMATEVLPEPPPTLHMPPPRSTDPIAVYPNAPPRPQPYGWTNDSPQVWRPPPPPPRPQGQQQTLAIVSLVLGLLAITFGWICGGPVLGLFAVILGVVALMQIKSNPAYYSGKPFALVGVVTGGIMLLFSLALMGLWVVTLIIGSLAG